MSGALLVRRKVLKELTGSNMWKAGFFSRQIGLDNPWQPAVKQIIKLASISSHPENDFD